MSIKTLFTDIAAAIKEKNTDIVTITPAGMPQAIRDISGGGANIELFGFPSLSANITDEYELTSSYEIFNDRDCYQAFGLGIGYMINVKTSSSAPQSLTIKFNSPKKVKIVISTGTGYYTGTTTSYIFQCSDDGENWSDLFTYKFSDYNSAYKIASIDNATEHLYYRFYLNASNGASGLKNVIFGLEV